ncbi:uncharacterized protein LOC128982950 isoform X1 [Macrosteles quadrilineatus]|uniref:uncharacterized protein LOC128982950 isoform X1 n=1 Tax=Macrosteles quadrilineatus TaxID=74068 RepID=UPI0023E17AA2|nr:uncharacterized protein LOC128982950 isoform X1 [Macrosteles quadrilineatus]
MSGIFRGERSNDPESHYHQRFNELVSKNHNRSVAPSTIGSLCESSISGKYFDSNQGQINNGTLSTNQFYKNNSNQNRENCLSQPLIESSSTYTGVSDASLFKKPLLPKRFNCSPRVKRRLDIFTDALCSIEDKQTLKFSMTVMEVLVDAVKNPPYAPPVNPVQLIDHMANLLKEEYFSKRVPKSICGSSVVSERSVEEFSDPRVVFKDITQDSVVKSQRTNLTQQLDYSTMNKTTTRPLAYGQQEMSMRSELGSQKSVLSSSRNLLDKLTEGTLTANINFLNDSEIARRRDEAAVSEESTVVVIPRGRNKVFPKATPRPTSQSNKTTKPPPTATRRPGNAQSKVAAPASKDCTLNQGQKDASMLNGTVTAFSRHGRTLKPPVKFWNYKGEDLSNGEEISESVFNESMTLRNKKVVEKKKTPPARGKKTNTPIESEKKSSSSKDKPKKKNEVTKQKKENIVKGPATKRKSKELNVQTNKKKKMENKDPDSYEEEYDIFGVNYKKPTHNNLKLALSPSAALLSAKKAAGDAQGKATPPCKAIGDMMANESMQSTMSAAKAAPKQGDYNIPLNLDTPRQR